MTVPVKTGRFEIGAPEPLFRTSFDPYSLQFGSAYAPAPDGQRFLIAESVQPPEIVLSVTMNWTPEAR